MQRKRQTVMFTAAVTFALSLSTMFAFADASAPAAAAAKADAKADAEQKKEDEVSIAFKDAPLEKICTFVGQKLGKPVIPHAKIKGKKITIIHSKKEPLSKALLIISNALRQNGIIILKHKQYLEFMPIEEARNVPRPVVGADESVTAIADKSRIVDKVFVVNHYDVDALRQVVEGMLPAYGLVIADPNVNKLIVTDTVANLERIEQMINSDFPYDTGQK